MYLYYSNKSKTTQFFVEQNFHSDNKIIEKIEETSMNNRNDNKVDDNGFYRVIFKFKIKLNNVIAFRMLFLVRLYFPII